MRSFTMICACAAMLVALVAAGAAAQSKRQRAEGVTNFGRVTDRYFRGGEVTAGGVTSLYDMGVRTIVNLRDKPSPEEEEAAKQLGITYHSFPMSGHAAPDPKTVDRILSIIRDAKSPVYVHCSAGKHRAGTICALYRMREQGWTAERAWDEQASYGFGPPEEHPELYGFVYGGETRFAVAKATSRDRKDRPRTKARPDVEKDDDDDDDAEDDDDDNDDDSGEEADDDDHDADDRDDKKADDDDDEVDADGAMSGADEPVITRPVEARPDIDPARSTAAALSATARYVELREVVRVARASGGSGDIVKIDLEYDPARGLTTWDVTFANAQEVEVDAASGKVLGAKPKAAAKMKVLSALGPDAGFAESLKTFQQIVAAGEQVAGRPVLEMELKRIAGRDDILYEVAFDDGSTVYFDAKTGTKIAGL